LPDDFLSSGNFFSMTNEKIIIGLVGQMASGKGTIAEYLRDKHGAEFFTFSTPLRDVLKRLHLETSRANLQKMSTLLRESFGQELLAKIITQDVEASPKNIVMVEGIRRFSDIKFLGDLKGFVLVRIAADEKIRYERLVKRAQNQNDKEKTFEQFIVDHQAEPELEIPKVMAEAKEEINNDGDFGALYAQIEKVLTKYRKE
jgi:Dephospho-CoA kinase